jgi:hypothetical protein
MQPTLDGFDSLYPGEGIQKKETVKFITDFFKDKQRTSHSDLLASSLLTLAANIDALLAKGRDISRVFDQYNSTLDRLVGLYQSADQSADQPEALSPEQLSLLEGFAQ